MTPDIFPRLSPPVQRPDLVTPSTIVDLTRGTSRELVDKLVRLMHGANMNDPAALAPEASFLRARAQR